MEDNTPCMDEWNHRRTLRECRENAESIIFITEKIIPVRRKMLQRFFGSDSLEPNKKFYATAYTKEELNRKYQYAKTTTDHGSLALLLLDNDIYNMTAYEFTRSAMEAILKSKAQIFSISRDIDGNINVDAWKSDKMWDTERIDPITWEMLAERIPPLDSRTTLVKEEKQDKRKKDRRTPY
jgi:hypothetical protein